MLWQWWLSYEPDWILRWQGCLLFSRVTRRDRVEHFLIVEILATQAIFLQALLIVVNCAFHLLVAFVYYVPVRTQKEYFNELNNISHHARSEAMVYMV